MDNPNTIVQNIVERLQRFEAENRNLRQLSAGSRTDHREALPEIFNGDRHRFRGFVNQVDLLFMINPHYYASDSLKVGLIGTLLCDKALAWFSPYLERNDPILADYTAFKKLLFLTFDEPDRSVVGAAKVRKLSQGNHSAFSYASEFRLLAANLDWNDAALVNQFCYGLNDTIKDLLLHHELPSTLEEMINLSIAIDNRIAEHRHETTRFHNCPPKTSLSSSDQHTIPNENWRDFERASIRPRTGTPEISKSMHVLWKRRTLPQRVPYCPKKKQRFKIQKPISFFSTLLAKNAQADSRVDPIH